MVILMFRMMILDSDKDCVDMIKKIVSECFKNIEVIDTSLIEMEEIELVETLMPEILLVDINLTEINGLEIVRRIRKNNKKIMIILSSVYDYVEFAIESFSLGVSDYIMKPLTNRNLAPSLERILETLTERQKTMLELSEKETLLKETMEYVEYCFIYSLLFNGGKDTGIKRYKALLGFSEFGYVINIEINTVQWEQSGFSEKDNPLLYKMIKEVLSEYGTCAVGSKMINRIIVFMNTKEDDSDTSQYIASKQMADLIVQKLREKMGIEVCIGIGEVTRLENLHDSYEEALKCLRYERTNEIIHIRETETKRIDYEEYIRLENKMLDNIKFGREETLYLFSQLLDYLRLLKEEECKNKIIELLVLACHAARIEGQNETEYMNYIGYIAEIKHISMKDIGPWIFSKLEYILKAVRTSRSTRKSDTIKEGLYYIEEHYAEEISLEEVSQYVGITPQHFSKIFKEETGANYVEYLTRLRIDMAVQCLSEGGKTIKEICYMVGYNDPNYFSRIFKKTLGTSPTDFLREVALPD